MCNSGGEEKPLKHKKDQGSGGGVLDPRPRTDISSDISIAETAESEN